jgi:hypothetical protein
VTKRYRETLETVELATDEDGAAPRTFRWRGHRYEVVSVLGHWREDPGWWRRPDGRPVRIEQTDMWRVEARNGHPGRGGVYELVRRDGTWKLDRVWD